MEKLFLHNGFNKTGSTSLQGNLAHNAAGLAKQGILYPYDPQAPFIQRWQHAQLAAAVPGRQLHWLLPRKRGTLEQAFAALHDRIAQNACDTLVLSS